MVDVKIKDNLLPGNMVIVEDQYSDMYIEFYYPSGTITLKINDKVLEGFLEDYSSYIEEE